LNVKEHSKKNTTNKGPSENKIYIKDIWNIILFTRI